MSGWGFDTPHDYSQAQTSQDNSTGWGQNYSEQQPSGQQDAPSTAPASGWANSNGAAPASSGPSDNWGASTQKQDDTRGWADSGAPQQQNGDAQPQDTQPDEQAIQDEKDAARLLEAFEAEVKVTLADRQADPNSPLYSAKTFEDLNLHPNLLKGIYKMGFTKPSRIQERALPLLLKDPPTNMIGQSQSGTGKTAAFVLTMLSRVDSNLLQPQAICIAPARELARQIMDGVDSMGEFIECTKFLAAKGARFRGMQIRDQIIVGTAGTILDMIRNNCLNLEHIKVFVLDEADNMLDTASMGDQSIQIKNAVLKSSPHTQIVLFSATFPEHVGEFATRFAPDANEIRLPPQELSLDAIKQFFMDCRDEDHKYEVLVELYNVLTVGQSIIFVGRRDTADEISRRMSAEGHKVISLHGALDTAERDDVMDAFRSGKFKVLISTNVIARGIDVLQVNMVVNYDIPIDVANNFRPDVETYLHRIGRTGRFGRQGVSINFVHDKRSFDNMSVIEDALQHNITKVSTDDFEVMEKTLKAALKN